MFFPHLRLLTGEFTYNYMKNIGGAREVPAKGGEALCRSAEDRFLRPQVFAYKNPRHHFSDTAPGMIGQTEADMDNEILRRTVYSMAAAALGALAAYLALRYLLPPALPFLIAYLISKAFAPIRRAMSRFSPKLDKTLTFLILCVFTCLAGWGIYALFSALVKQICSLFAYLSSTLGNEDNPLRASIEFFVNLRERFPRMGFDEAEAEKVYSVVSEIVKNATVKASSFVTDIAASAAAALPSAVVAFFVSLTAVFYFTLDRGDFLRSLREIIPERACGRLVLWKDRITDALWKYFKTYLVMMLFVFAQLYLGFTVIGIKYSLILALVIAFIDLLPVLGVGTVLIPWGLIAVISGDVHTGVGLLILFGIMSVIRQFSEPHIIGSALGIHPLLALIAVYCGMELFGLCGLIFAPVVLYLMRSFSPSAEKKDG